MALSLFNIKKWTKMLFGKSILHVNQGVGKVYSVTEIEGYYNDFTEKVTKDSPDTMVPKAQMIEGDPVYFPTAIFQFGLGAYDLYLLEKDEKYLEKVKSCAKWALDNQNNDGSWNNFFFLYPKTPYSAMSQGEGISLLARAYVHFKDEKYLNAAKKAYEFMVKSYTEGGTTKYENDDIYLMEFTNKSVVLNGWIFALFGVIDYLKLFKDDKDAIDLYYKTTHTLRNSLADFDTGYWSYYNYDKLTCSPFYHKLHIAQLKALYDITEVEEFKNYAQIWEKYSENKLYKARAFIKKAIEKIKERG